ncbi:MAG: hypothetical protein RSD13_01065 [Clostridium sp.]
MYDEMSTESPIEAVPIRKTGTAAIDELSNSTKASKLLISIT